MNMINIYKNIIHSEIISKYVFFYCSIISFYKYTSSPTPPYAYIGENAAAFVCYQQYLSTPGASGAGVGEWVFWSHLSSTCVCTKRFASQAPQRTLPDRSVL